MAGRKQVTENLLLFLEGAAIDLEGRMDAVTDVLATLIDGDAGRYDRCLDRLWERLQSSRDVQGDGTVSAAVPARTLRRSFEGT